MKKKLVSLVAVVLTVMMLFAMVLPASAASFEGTVDVSSATITSSEDADGNTVYTLNVKVTNRLETVESGKTVGLQAYAFLTLTGCDTTLFTPVGGAAEVALGTVASSQGTPTPVNAYDTVTATFEIVPADGADLKGLNEETEVTYQVHYLPVLPHISAEDQAAMKYETAEGTVTVNEKVTELGTVQNFLKQTGFYSLFAAIKDNWQSLIMILIAFLLMYLAIVKKFEPLLLLPIAFGMLLTNLPGAGMYHEFLFAGGHVNWAAFSANAGLLDYLYLGVKLGIYPCLIFIGVGAMTDFGPLIANPKSLLLGAAAQLGIFVTFVLSRLTGFTAAQAGSIGIIGGADGPTAIFVTSKLAPELLGPIAVAAYSYMALVPVIQPPIMRLLTTKKEREISMKELRPVSKREKIIFPIAVTAFVALLVPSAASLVGCLMLGNLIKESGVAERLAKTVQNELMNIVTIFLGITVGATATSATFLQFSTLKIIIMGVFAFGLGTAGGVLLAKFMNLFLKEKINPLIGSAGVSAVPMAARVSQVEGQKAKPGNYLLMHAMGPNVAGVIGSAIAAGVLLSLFGA